MLKKTIRRLGALAMVLAMAVSVFAVNASAANNPETVTINKVLTKSADAPVPNTSFSFKIEAGEPGTYQQDGKADIAITPGTAMQNVTTGAGVEAANKLSVSYTATITLPTYTAAGIYSYKVSEVDGEYDGISYSNKVYTMLVFVDNTNSVYAVSIDGKGLGKENLNFTNEYATKNVTVKKKVEGKQAEMERKFDITITITGTAGKSYTVVKSADPTNPITITAGTNGVASTTIALGNDETYTVSGLSEGDKYTVEEKDYSGEGYTVSYDSERVNQTANNNTIIVTNTRDAATPGGVIMTIAPYALMVVLAGAFAVVFLTRRNRAE